MININSYHMLQNRPEGYFHAAALNSQLTSKKTDTSRSDFADKIVKTKKTDTDSKMKNSTQKQQHPNQNHYFDDETYI